MLLQLFTLLFPLTNRSHHHLSIATIVEDGSCLVAPEDCQHHRLSMTIIRLLMTLDHHSPMNSSIRPHLAQETLIPNSDLSDTFTIFSSSESLFDRLFPFSPLERYKDTSLRHMSKGTLVHRHMALYEIFQLRWKV
ncbi:hypothetical protein WUBG_11545 [Wuchereria bancrofti]|uniref:Uncharacterized protein n=1 Tax=Wuchereria bancrofti TaxID=6293 RepID=J9EKN0_WUCBA|nr:hypothetical protein WUBG_11545 [Wuchereria bancrofti]